MVIAELIRTCAQAPSQWEGRLADGRPVYIRYRWGELRVHVGPHGGSIEDAITAEPWFAEAVGDRMGAYIELHEVAACTGIQMP